MNDALIPVPCLNLLIWVLAHAKQIHINHSLINVKRLDVEQVGEEINYRFAE